MKTSARRLSAFLLLLIAGITSILPTSHLLAAETETSDWEYAASIYLWAPSLAVGTETGREVTIPFHQILSDLEMVLMGNFAARKDKWTFSTDVIYMNLSQDDQKYIPEGLADSEIDMKAWIVTPTIGHEVHASEEAQVEVFGGLRYLWMDMDLEIDINGEREFSRTGSDTFWAGIFGVRAFVDINDNWFVPSYIDAGTGGGAFTWQAMTGIGYRFSRFEGLLTYRYLRYNFHDLNVADMTVKGPLLGAIFRF